MGATKSGLFTQQQNDLANMAKAIAHPARIAILQFLLRTNACVCGSIVDEIGLAQATISQHLKELKTAGLIQGTVDGTSVCYCINPTSWYQIRDILSAFFTDIPEGHYRCSPEVTRSSEAKNCAADENCC
ncbi:ArsR/SmtB family transcription factor [Taibaiella soli]|uniref:Transcriptional regulator n=1 Tax=Taibaiella soli TaxID=1649169 RepID=A0A2W2BF11_9BACT|nr:metalloregulator ArsR/SmtB family transcription factor [Taibaiella soli]PZF74859.1 transcriptional regulator [Taibaiella soli]